MERGVRVIVMTKHHRRGGGDEESKRYKECVEVETCTRGHHRFPRVERFHEGAH